MFYWDVVKRFGWPNGNGWGNEPINFFESVYALDIEHDKVEAEEQRKRQEEMSKHKPQRKSRRR